jgi:hypothetical protein
MRDVGPIGISVMASGEPVSEAQCVAARVAARLVGGLPSWNGERDGRVSRLATKLVRLQQADAAERNKAAPRKKVRA